MTTYLISFPSAAMELTPDEFAAAGADARAVVQEAKDAGVFVFGGGIDESVPPAVVADDGSLGAYTPRGLDGGFCVLDLPSREAALEWAAKMAAACRCPQELQQFMSGPAS